MSDSCDHGRFQRSPLISAITVDFCDHEGFSWDVVILSFSVIISIFSVYDCSFTSCHDLSDFLDCFAIVQRTIWFSCFCDILMSCDFNGYHRFLAIAQVGTFVIFPISCDRTDFLGFLKISEIFGIFPISCDRADFLRFF